MCRRIGVGLFLFCFCPVIYAGSMDQKVTVSVKKVTLQEAISAIMKQTDYGISYNVDEISNIRNVSLSVKDASVEEALKECLAPYGFTFSVHGQTIVISAALPQQVSERDVEGMVVDSEGEPLAGVSIIGHQKGHDDVRGITDMNGRFKLKLPGGVKQS